MAENSEFLGIASSINIDSSLINQVIEKGCEYPFLGIKIDKFGLVTFSPSVNVIRQTFNQHKEPIVITRGQFRLIRTGFPREPNGEIRYMGPLNSHEITIRPI